MALVPGTAFVGLYPRPHSRVCALSNLRQALALLWRMAKVRGR